MSLYSLPSRGTSVRSRPDRSEGPGPVLGQHLFENALVRERLRADRSNGQMALVLVVSDESDSLDRASWDAVLSAIDVSRRVTDLLGWRQPGVSVGLILTEIRTTSRSAGDLLRRRIGHELERRLDTATMKKLEIRLHVYPGPDAVGGTVSTEPETGLDLPLVPLIEDIRLRGRTASYQVAKRGIDIVLSAVLLILLSPLLLLIAVAIKSCSRGPILFRQTRIGQEAKAFTMHKFRTMVVDADHDLHEAYVTDFITESAAGSTGTARRTFKITDDPRVTRLGRLLRMTSLDELPQLWNVLCGEMSLVGPRPPLPYEVEQYKSWHLRRVLEATPGITGLWQVKGRSRTTFDEMVRLDLRYVRTMSFWTDLKILVATPRAVIAGEGAH